MIQISDPFEKKVRDELIGICGRSSCSTGDCPVEVACKSIAKEDYFWGYGTCIDIMNSDFRDVLRVAERIGVVASNDDEVEILTGSLEDIL